VPNVPDTVLPAVPRLRAIIDEVVGLWHAHEADLADWPAAERTLPAPAEPRWEHLAWRLQLINTFQWHEEDRSRAHGAGDAVLAAVKRSIDASNRRRVQTIDALDVHLHEATTATITPAADAVLNSETPGSIIDRLTVLALKRYHVAEALAAAEGDDRPAMQARLDTIVEQFDDLAGCLERLLADLRAGRVRLKLYRQVKVYRDPATGQLRADVS
jgi:hypothetical protein